MKIKKLKEYDKKKIIIFMGSARNKNNCPDQDSKTSLIIKEALKRIKDKKIDIDIELLDLSIEDDKPIIQPCKGCISTSGGAHCHWPCDCYIKGDKDHPDFISEFNIYEKLQKSDAFIVFSPINWWSVTTQIKALFDRLVCASLTITTEQALDIFGDDLKNSKKTKKFSETDEYKKMVKNHLEGKIAGFYVHGDNGANDYKGRKLPDTMNYNIGDFNDPKYAILPIVWQCRYMGIDVPDKLIESFYMNHNISYSKANDKLKNGELDFAINKAEKLIIDTYNYINEK
jgi:multimeric flavodoxin WrbA